MSISMCPSFFTCHIHQQFFLALLSSYIHSLSSDNHGLLCYLPPAGGLVQLVPISTCVTHTSHVPPLPIIYFSYNK
jgi:hypothetical protein